MLIWLNLPLYVPAYLCILCVYHVHVCACIRVGFNVSVCFVNVCLRLSSASVRAECVLDCLSSVRKRLCVCVCLKPWRRHNSALRSLKQCVLPPCCLSSWLRHHGWHKELSHHTHPPTCTLKRTQIYMHKHFPTKYKPYSLSHTHTLSSLCCIYACRNHKDICTVNTKPPWVSVPNIAHSCTL